MIDSIVSDNEPRTALGVGMAAFDRPSRKTIGGLTEAAINAGIPPTCQRRGLRRASLKLGSPSTYASSDSTVRHAGAQQCWYFQMATCGCPLPGKYAPLSLLFLKSPQEHGTGGAPSEEDETLRFLKIQRSADYLTLV